MNKFKRRVGEYINYLECGLTQIYCEEENLKQRVYNLIAFFNANEGKLVRSLDVSIYLGGAMGSEAYPEDEIKLYDRGEGEDK